LKKTITVIFNPPSSRWSAARSLFSAIGQAALASAPQEEFGYALKFTDNEKYETFVGEAKARGFPPGSYSITEVHEFTVQELESSALVLLIARGKPRGLGGPSCGTTYDLSRGCPRCGTGAPQLSPLFVNRNDAPKRSNVWPTLGSELLLDADLSSALDGATGVEMREARSCGDSRPLPWYQMIPLYELPPMAITTIGTVKEDGPRPCPLCRRDGFFFNNTLFTIRYELDLAHVPDVSHTYECFGFSAVREPLTESHFAQPMPIVRGSVYARLIAAGAKDVAGYPVEVIDRASHLSKTAT
jgi:hypothetical protein